MEEAEEAVTKTYGSFVRYTDDDDEGLDNNNQHRDGKGHGSAGREARGVSDVDIDVNARRTVAV